jgi:hypothetical protein
VERYGRGGTFWELHPELPYLPVTAWQVWNEPNVPVFFGGSVKVSKYGLLLRQAAEAIRAADPAASVVTAGIFRYNVKGKGLGMAAFLKRFYSLDGIKRSFDVLALHPYAARPRGVLRISHQGRRIMKRSGDPWTPVWLTEVGWPTGGVGWKRNMLRATPRQQARWLRRTYRLIRRNRWLRVRRVYWHQYQDFDYPDSPDPWQARMGLVDVDERPKPAWYAYARAADGTP